MADTREYIRNNYPLPVYNYRVTVLGDEDAPTIAFTEVSGLTMEHEAVVYRHGFSFVMGEMVLAGMKQLPHITLKKGIVKANTFLFNWVNKTYNEPYYSLAKRDVLIHLCNDTGDPLVTWTARKAMPTKLDAPNFDANSNEVAVESMELIAQSLTVSHAQ